MTAERRAAIANLHPAGLEIRVLGPLEVITPGGDAVAVNGQKLRTLLAALALHAGQVIVADGTPEAARRIERVLTTDPGMGVVRHADAGYEEAIEFAEQNDVKIPMRK